MQDQLNSDTKDAFKVLADIIEESIVSIKEDTNEKCKTLANTVMKLYSKIKKMENSPKVASNSIPKMKTAKTPVTVSNLLPS